MIQTPSVASIAVNFLKLATALDFNGSLLAIGGTCGDYLGRSTIFNNNIIIMYQPSSILVWSWLESHLLKEVQQPARRVKRHQKIMLSITK